MSMIDCIEKVKGIEGISQLTVVPEDPWDDCIFTYMNG